jgi:hypothetical protein
VGVRLSDLSESWVSWSTPAKPTLVLGPLLISYRRRLPERPLPRLIFACGLEAVAIALLAIPDLSTRVISASSLLAIAVALVYFTLFRSGLTVSVHEYGIKVAHGGREEIALYSHVARVFSRGVDGPGGGKIELYLQLGDKRTLSIEGWDDQLRPACEAILERATGVIAPRVLADFYAGEAVDFGAVRLSKTFIASNRGRLPIRRIADAVVRRGRFLVISDDGHTFVSMERSEIANLEALLMLLSRMRRPVAAGRSS